MSIGKLKKAIDATWYDIEIEIEPPCDIENEGIISLNIDQETGMQFAASNASCLVRAYWSDVKGSKQAAINDLIYDLSCGFEPMSEETKHACGID